VSLQAGRGGSPLGPREDAGPEGAACGDPKSTGAVQATASHVSVKQLQPVALRVELATKAQAQIMQWGALVFMLCLFLLSILLVVTKNQDVASRTQPHSMAFYKAVLVLSCLSLGAVLATSVVFMWRTLQSFRSGLVW
jgi:hypothetical protein